MAIALPLDQMSVDDKLCAMEELWADLSRDPAAVPMPQWHAQELDAREARLESGDARCHEWAEVRRRLQTVW